MMIDLWKVVTVILGIILIGMSIQPVLTGLASVGASNDKVSSVGASTNEVVNVELFVMSYCPYGTQTEKGLLPVIEALGDNVNFKLRFVYYAMHGKKEVDEQLNQYCIQKEHPDQLIDYLWCFLEDADGEGCLNKLGLNVSTCVTAADAEFGVTAAFEDTDSWLSGRFPLFPIDQSLNTQYGIRGSPGLVINGKTVQPTSRASSAYLAAICAEFETQPAACSQSFSSSAPSPGFGLTGTGSATTATCG